MDKHRKPIELPPADVEKALAGNRAAFQRLIERVWGPVFVFVNQRVRDREQARDLTQETFLQAYDKRATLRKGDSFVAWVFTIASRKVIDHYRRSNVGNGAGPASASSLDQATLDQVTLEITGTKSSDLEQTPQQELEAEEEAEQLRQAVEQLEDRYRTILVLRYWSGLSPGQIARLLGEPEGTIRNRVFRAHKRLRAVLETNNRDSAHGSAGEMRTDKSTGRRRRSTTKKSASKIKKSTSEKKQGYDPHKQGRDPRKGARESRRPVSSPVEAQAREEQGR